MLWGNEHPAVDLADAPIPLVAGKRKPSPETRLTNYPDLTEQSWEDVLERLTLYAHRRYTRLVWRGVPGAQGGTAPGGVEPADLAAESIIDTIAGRRTWNRATEPDFLQFLRGVVDSKLNHLALSLENRTTRGTLPATTDAGEGIDVIPDETPTPESQVSAEEERTRLEAVIRSLVEGDALASQILECLRSDVTRPSEMATRIGVDVREIYKAQKRLRHRVVTALRAEDRGSS